MASLSGRRRASPDRADDRLGGWWLAVELASLVVDETRLQRGHLVGCHATQTLLIPADRGPLDDDRTQPAVGSAEHDGMPAGIAGTPEANPFRIDGRMVFKEGDRPAPIGDLDPRVDVKAGRAVTGSEAAMVMHQHDEPRFGEQAGKPLQPVFLHPGKAVCHSDTRMWSRAVGHKQPTPQNRIAFDGNSTSFAAPSLLLPCAVQQSPCALRPRRRSRNNPGIRGDSLRLMWWRRKATPSGITFVRGGTRSVPKMSG